MPFPCGQEWTGTTRANHSPSSKAIDWNRPDDLGDQVVAAAPGVVTRAEPKGNSGYGHYVRVEHENGENTIYAHLTSVVVKVGQRLDQGALLGTVGETGNATGPHLHFEERSSSGVVAPFFDGGEVRLRQHPGVAQLRGRAGRRQLPGRTRGGGGRLPAGGDGHVPGEPAEQGAQGAHARHRHRPARRR